MPNISSRLFVDAKLTSTQSLGAFLYNISIVLLSGANPVTFLELTDDQDRYVRVHTHDDELDLVFRFPRFFLFWVFEVKTEYVILDKQSLRSAISEPSRNRLIVIAPLSGTQVTFEFSSLKPGEDRPFTIAFSHGPTLNFRVSDFATLLHS